MNDGGQFLLSWNLPSALFKLVTGKSLPDTFNPPGLSEHVVPPQQEVMFSYGWAEV